MDQNTIERIAEIEREIAVLPAGSVSKKNVHGLSLIHISEPTRP